jgi:hypothetical protein
MTPQAQPAPAAPSTLPPEQVKFMQMLVKQALGVLLEDDTARFLVDKAKNGDPKTALVETVVPLIKSIYEAAGEAGVKIDMVAVLGAGMQIITILAKMLESEGILTEEQIPAFAADVAKLASEQHNAGVQAGQQGKPNAGAAPGPTGPVPGSAPGMIQQGAPA